jgi:hypothetical protein
MVEFHCMVVTQRYKSVTLKMARLRLKLWETGILAVAGASEIFADVFARTRLVVPVLDERRMMIKKMGVKSRFLLIIAESSHL